MYKRSNFLLVILILAFFISGASALIYQILWVKVLTLTFGSTTLAVTTILASFMGGLALGSFLMSKYSYRIHKVILAYGLIELVIGLYALFMPLLFRLSDEIYRYIWPLVDGNDYIVTFVRFLLTALILLIPTTLMGATLPLLVKFYVDKDELIVKYTSILYGVNTLGAVLGAFLCGFFLLETLGMFKTNLVAVSINCIAAFIAVMINNKYKNPDYDFSQQIKTTVNKVSYSYQEEILLLAMFISGFTAMVYEIVWARQLVLIFGSTTYAYTSMLSIFLIGIAFGSLFISDRFLDNSKNVYYFGILGIVIGILVNFGAFYYKDLFYLYLLLMRNFDPSFYILPIIVVTAILILPVAIVFGILFPVSIKLFTPAHEAISERTGTIYSFNTIGCILGSICCGFVLIPCIGLKWSLMFAACMNIIIGGVYLFIHIQKKSLKITTSISILGILLLLLLLPPKWDKELISIGAFTNKHGYYTRYKNLDYNKFFKSTLKKRIVYYKEGYHSTVAVSESLDTFKKPTFSLYNNGKVDASTTKVDMRTQILIGYLPAFITKKLNNVLIVGMGSGITTAVVEKLPVKTIELVELEKAVVDARKSFSHIYGDPLEDKRLKVIYDDARNYLRVINKKYDVIISEPSNVWVSGVAGLFTRDYYRIIKKKLKPNGILVQWLQLYSLKSDAVISVLKALKSEFKYVYIFYPKTNGDFIFVASENPIILDLDTIKNVFNDNFIAHDFAKMFNITNEYEFFNLIISDNTRVERYIMFFTKNIPINTDDNSYLEFNATKDFLSACDAKYTIEPVKMFTILKGVNKNDIKNPPENFYKRVVMALIAQLNRSYTGYSETPSEEQLNLKQMLAYAEKYYEEFPTKDGSMTLLGTTLLDNSLITGGIAYLKEAARRNTKDPIAYKILSQYYNRLIYLDAAKLEPSQAIKYAQSLKTLEPANPFTYFLLGISEYNNNNYTNAKKYLEQYYKMAKKNNKPIDSRMFDYFSKAYFQYKN